MRKYGHIMSGASVILAVGLLFAVNVQVAQGQEVSEADIRGLPGYKSYSTLGSFTERLRQDPALFDALQGNEDLSARILGSTMTQRQVLSEIDATGNVQHAVSKFLDGTDTDSLSSRRPQAENQDKLETRTSKRISRSGSESSGNANLAAQRAIERAQRNREAANQRAADIMAKSRKIMDREQNAEALARQKEDIITSNKAVAEVLAELSDQPEALQAFLSDGKLLQKVMDKEVTLSQALADVGADLNEDTASAGDAAVAENDTPASPPAPEDNQQALDDLLSTLEQVNPAAHTLLSEDEALQESVLSCAITFDELLADLSNNCKTNNDSCDTGLVYNGEKVVNINQVPQTGREDLDENGWPKYLNVPADCPPATKGVDYFFNHRYSARDNSGMTYIKGMERLQGGGVHHVSHTVKERSAIPFYTRGSSEFTMLSFKVDQDYDLYIKGIKAISISHCPDDFRTPLPKVDGKEQLAVSCRPYAKKYPVSVGEQGRVLGMEGCQLKPYNRYFLNIANLTYKHAMSENGYVAAPERKYVPISKEKYEKIKKERGQEERLRPILLRLPQPVHPEKDHPDNEGLFQYQALKPLENGDYTSVLRFPGILSQNDDLITDHVEVAFAPAAKYWSRRATDINLSIEQVRKKISRILTRTGKNYLDTTINGFIRFVVADHANLSTLFPEGQRPYNGPCLNENFYSSLPMNYNSSNCGRAFKSYAGVRETTWVCRDALGKLPPLTMQLSCKSEKCTWVQGYNKPVYSSYVCEKAKNTNPYHMTCAAHREGEYRTEICPGYYSGRSHMSGIHHVQQCQFDAAGERYRWMSTALTEVDGPAKHFCRLVTGNRLASKNLSGQSQHYGAPLSPVKPNSCYLNGRNYTSGEKITIQCEKGTNVPAVSANFRCKDLSSGLNSPSVVMENNGSPMGEAMSNFHSNWSLVGELHSRGDCKILSE